MDVGDIMTRAVRTCHLNDSLAQAARIMWDGDFGCVPVVDPRGKAVAMITDRDICMAASIQDKTLGRILVRSVMSSPLLSVDTTASVEAVQTLMEQHRVRRIVVVDDEGYPVGIVGVNDLVRHTRGVSRHQESLPPESVVRTLSEIGYPAIPHFAAAAE